MAAEVTSEADRLRKAMKLYEQGEISSGAAAKLAGISRAQFLSRLAEFGVNAFQQTPAEARADYEGRPQRTRA